jgi:hypothetical protein
MPRKPSYADLAAQLDQNTRRMHVAHAWINYARNVGTTLLSFVTHHETSEPDGVRFNVRCLGLEAPHGGVCVVATVDAGAEIWGEPEYVEDLIRRWQACSDPYKRSFVSELRRAQQAAIERRERRKAVNL